MRITPIRSVWKLMSRRVPSLQYFHTSFSSAMLSGVWNSSTDAPSRASSWTKTFILKSPQLQVLEARRSNRLQAKCLLTGNERMRFPVSAKIDAVSAGAITRSEERRVGKECGVRVDPGGRRIIKKKKKKKN